MTAPWVQPGPIDVPPHMLRWQCGDTGPRRLSESPHAIGAVQMINGMDPMSTAYAEQVVGVQTGTHGKPKALATLVISIRDAGWSGPPIIAWINRRGEIVIHDGWHRSAAALAAGLKTIPVSIHGRDEDWIALRHAVQRLNNGRKLYQPIFHPDFDCWPCWRKDTAARIDQIADWLTGAAVYHVCDLGCHTGTISHGMARKGFKIVAIDQNPLAVRVATLMRPMSDIGSLTVATCCTTEPAESDAIVCLSAINHALVTDQDKANEMVDTIRRRCRYLVTDCPTPGDPVGGDTDWTNPGAMVEWLKGRGFMLLDQAERGDVLQRTMMFFEVMR